jgi:hypothetical protein
MAAYESITLCVEPIETPLRLVAGTGGDRALMAGYSPHFSDSVEINS